MALNLAEMKKQQAGLLARIKKTVEDKGSSNSYEDERIWNVTFDKDKGGSAVIRFLPSPDGPTEMPYEKIIKHFFQGPNGKYYTERSLRTLDKPDPVADLNYRLYNTKVKSNQDQASRQKQKPRFYTNILVIKDPANPENNGKTFLYEYGPAVQNMIEEKLFPDAVLDPDVESINPFDVFNAPNLMLKLIPQQLGTKVVPNYNKSTFDHNLTELPGNIVDIVNAGYSLKEFKDPSKFKSYEDLSKKLVEVLGDVTGTGIETVTGFSEVTTDAPVAAPVVNVAPQADSTVYDTQAVEAVSNTNSDDDIAALRALMDA